MGLMRFLVPRRSLAPTDAADRAYLTGLDEIPWQTRVQWTADGLVARRSESDSGSFHIPWNVTGEGELMLATSTLIERAKPYHLTVELARGSIYRLRNQLAAWESIGLETPAAVTQLNTDSLGHFSRAATNQEDLVGADEAATLALETAHQAMRELVTAYVRQSFVSRQRGGSKGVKLLGVSLGRATLKEPVQREIVANFNAGLIPLPWREIEPREGKYEWSLPDRQIDWLRVNSLRACVGPILQLDRGALPDWLYLWEDDFKNLAAVIASHIKTVVERYRGKTGLWNCAARLNVPDAFSLTEEQRLRLAVLAVEVTREADPRTPVVLSVDQPWGEYMGRQSSDLSPLHFADALVRAELGLAGLIMEINLGYHPGGTQPRDLLDFSRQVDRWSCLGLPLIVSLTIPSDTKPDSQARVTGQVVPAAGEGQWTVGKQSAWAAELTALMMSKPLVQAVFYNQTPR